MYNGRRQGYTCHSVWRVTCKHCNCQTNNSLLTQMIHVGEWRSMAEGKASSSCLHNELFVWCITPQSAWSSNVTAIAINTFILPIFHLCIIVSTDNVCLLCVFMTAFKSKFWFVLSHFNRCQTCVFIIDLLLETHFVWRDFCQMTIGSFVCLYVCVTTTDYILSQTGLLKDTMKMLEYWWRKTSFKRRRR